MRWKFHVCHLSIQVEEFLGLLMIATQVLIYATAQKNGYFLEGFAFFVRPLGMKFTLCSTKWLRHLWLL